MAVYCKKSIFQRGFYDIRMLCSELKDSLGNEGMTDVNMPLLLQSIMQYDPLAFKGGPVYDTAASAGNTFDLLFLDAIKS